MIRKVPSLAKLDFIHPHGDYVVKRPNYPSAALTFKIPLNFGDHLLVGAISLPGGHFFEVCEQAIFAGVNLENSMDAEAIESTINAVFFHRCIVLVKEHSFLFNLDYFF